MNIKSYISSVSSNKLSDLDWGIEENTKTISDEVIQMQSNFARVKDTITLADFAIQCPHIVNNHTCFHRKYSCTVHNNELSLCLKTTGEYKEILSLLMWIRTYDSLRKGIKQLNIDYVDLDGFDFKQLINELPNIVSLFINIFPLNEKNINSIKSNVNLMELYIQRPYYSYENKIIYKKKWEFKSINTKNPITSEESTKGANELMLYVKLCRKFLLLWPYMQSSVSTQ